MTFKKSSRRKKIGPTQSSGGMSLFVLRTFLLTTQKKYALSLFGCLLVGGAGGLFFSGSQAINSQATVLRASGYTFVRPLLEVEFPEQSKEFKPLQKKVSRMVEQAITNGDANRVGVYFRGLNQGRWLGVHEDEKFAPASLLKVPIMLSYLKLAETDPSILSRQFVYRGLDELSEKQNIKSGVQLKIGASYSVEQLLRYMIQRSDNNAMVVLREHLDPEKLKQTFRDIGLADAYIAKNDKENFMSPKTYALVFRMLYNGTYLSRGGSEKALRLLSEVEFKEGLVAGVPSSVAVVHKFGERQIIVATTGEVKTRELHDCGIVYDKETPYLLCIMTEGTDFTKLQKTIAKISSLAYEDAHELLAAN